MKTWKADFEVFWDASHIESVIVKANTKRKAILFAEKKVKERSGWDSPILRNIEEIEEEKGK